MRLISILNFLVEEKVRVVGGGGGYEKMKMKGKWLVIIKGEVVVVSSLNGDMDVECEFKGSVLYYWGGVDGWLCLIEGYGYRFFYWFIIGFGIYGWVLGYNG